MEEDLLPPPPKKQEVVDLLPPPPKKSAGQSFLDAAGNAVPFVRPIAQPIAALAEGVGKNIYDIATNTIPNAVAGYVQRQASGAKDSAILNALTSEKDKAAVKQAYSDVAIGGERYIQGNKQDSEKLLQGTTRRLEDIKDVNSFMSFVGSMAGQGAGQIIPSVASFGTSSYLQESATVYDQQLDILAEKYGISREEVIRKGLDSPAAGQAYAILAAALDTASAGLVLKAFKSGGGKILKAAMPTLVETVTEPVQGILEEVGASAAVDGELQALSNATTTKEGLLRRANEAAGGLIGSGAISAAGAFKSPASKAAPKQEELASIAQEIDNDTQGLPDDIVKSIDDSANETARFIDQLADLDLGNTSKVAEGITKAEELANSNIEEENRLASEAARLEVEKAKLAFDKAPAIPLAMLPEAPNKTLDAQNEVEEGGLYLKGFAPAEDIANKPVAPVVAPTPVGLTTKVKSVKGKKVNTYDFNDEAGTAQGNIKGEFANIDTIYAAKDAEGNAKRGGKLYNKVIDALENKGVKTLTIGSQSENSQAALDKLVKTGRLTVDPAGTIKTGKSLFQPEGSTINTRFTINPISKPAVVKEPSVPKVKVETKPIKITNEKEQDKERRQEELLKKKEADKLAVIERAKAKEVEKIEAKRVKLTTQLTNAKKRGTKPSLKLKAFDKIAEQANELGLTDLANQAQELSRKEFEAQEAKKEQVVVNKEKVAATPSAEEVKAAREEAKIEKAKKVAAKAINKPVLIKKETVAISGELFEDKDANDEQPSTKTLNQVKQAYYNKMAEFTEAVRAKVGRDFSAKYRELSPEGIEKFNKIVEEYKQFRKDNGLKEESDDSIKRGYSNEVAQKAAKKEIENEAKGERKQKQSKKDAEAAAKADFLKSIGENPAEFELGFDEKTSTSYYIKSGLKEAGVKRYNKDNVEKTTVSGLLSRLPKSFRNKAISKLLPIVQKALKKQGKEIKIYIYDSKSKDTFGFYATGKNHDILLIAKHTLEDNGVTNGKTVLHETLHGYFEVISSALLGTDEKFTRAVTRIYDNAKQTWLAALKEVITNPLTASKQSVAIFNASLADIQENFSKGQANQFRKALEAYNKLTDKTDKAKLLDKILETFKAPRGGVYGFTSHIEMLAEIGASTTFANLLNTIPYKSNYDKGKTFTSVLSQLFNELKARFTDFIGKKEADTAFSELEYVINNFSEEYENSKDVEFEYDPYYDTPSIGDYIDTGMTPKQAAMEQRMAALGMSIAKEGEGEFDIDLKISKKALTIRRDILNNLVGTLAKIKDIKTFNDVKEYINRVNKRLPADKQLGDVYALLVIGKINKERALIAESIKNQKIRLDQAKLNPEYETNFEFQNMVDDFGLVDIEKLTKKERKEYNIALKDLVFNRAMSQDAINIVINKGKKEHILKNLLPIAEKVNKAYNDSVTDLIPVIGAKAGAAIPAFGKVGFENISSPALFTSIISKYKSLIGDKVYKYIYVNVAKAMAKANLESHAILSGIEDIADKNKFTHLDFARVGMFGRIFATIENPDNLLEWEKEVKENAENVLESAKNKLEALNSKNYYGDLNKTLIEEEIKLAQELVDNLNTKVDMGILSKGQKELYDYIRKFYTKHEATVRRNAISVHGNEDYQERFNYFPSRASGKIDGDFKADALLNEGADNLMDAVGDNAPKKGYIGMTENKAKKARKNLEGYYYDFDTLSIMQKGAKRLLFDLYTSMEFKTLNRLLKDSRFKNESTGFGKAITNGFFHQLQNIAGSNRETKSYERLTKGTQGVFKITDAFMRTNIATIAQALYQASSGVAAAAVLSTQLNPVTGLRNLAKAIKYATATLSPDSKESQFLRDNALSIHGRAIDFERAVEPNQYSTAGTRRQGKIRTAIENFNIKPASEGDKWAAKVTWFASYLEAGGTLENPSKDAVIRAERVAGTLQGMSDINFSAPLFRHNNQYKKIFFMMTYSYKSFALNAAVGLKTSAKQVFSSKEARQVAVAQIAGLFAYRFTAGAIGTAISTAVLGGLMGLGGDDDDEEKKNYSGAAKVTADALWDMGVGLDQPAMVDGIVRFGFNNLIAPSIYSNDEGMYDQYVDSPIFSVSPKNPSGLFKNIGAPISNDIATVLIDGIVAGAELQALDEIEDMGSSKEAKAKLDLELAKLGMISALYSGLEGAPLKGDVKKIIREYGKIKEKELRKAQ